MQGKIAGVLLCVIASLAQQSLADERLSENAKVPKAVSDKQAASEAQDNRKLAEELWSQNLQACEARDMRQLFAIMKAASGQLKAQPTDHLKYRARFVYSSCQQMLLDISFLNGACLNRTPSEHTWNYSLEHWASDSEACDNEIAHPDLSYDDPEPTDEELVRQFRSEGKSEEDIEFIMKLRKL